MNGSCMSSPIPENDFTDLAHSVEGVTSCVKGAWKEFFRGVTPQEFFSFIGEQPGVQLRHLKLSIEPKGGLCLEASGCSGGAHVFEMKRFFRYEDVLGSRARRKIAVHEKLAFSPSFQDNRLAAPLLRVTVESYVIAGFDRIDLCANIDMGSYAWAHYGFFAKPGEVQRLIDQILLKVEDDASWTGRQRRLISESLRNDIDPGDPGSVLLISDFELEGEPIGKKLMEWTRWNGYLDLNDDGQLKSFRSYVT